MSRFNNIIIELEPDINRFVSGDIQSDPANLNNCLNSLLELKQEDESEFVESMSLNNYCLGALVFMELWKYGNWAYIQYRFFQILDHLKDIFSNDIFNVIIDRWHVRDYRKSLIKTSFYCGEKYDISLNTTFDIIEKYFDREFHIIYSEGFETILDWIIYKECSRSLVINALSRRNFIVAEFDLIILDEFWKNHNSTDDFDDLDSDFDPELEYNSSDEE